MIRGQDFFFEGGGGLRWLKLTTNLISENTKFCDQYTLKNKGS